MRVRPGSLLSFGKLILIYQVLLLVRARWCSVGAGEARLSPLLWQAHPHLSGALISEGSLVQCRCGWPGSLLSFGKLILIYQVLLLVRAHWCSVGAGEARLPPLIRQAHPHLSGAPISEGSLVQCSGSENISVTADPYISEFGSDADATRTILWMIIFLGLSFSPLKFFKRTLSKNVRAAKRDDLAS